MAVRKRKGSAFCAFSAAIVAVLALTGCGTGGSVPTRPVRVLPSAASINGGYVTRLLRLPVGYRAAGRDFYLNAPRMRGPLQPLVLILHGLDQRPASVEVATHAISFSESHHFTLVYPIGEREAWDAGGCCRHATTNDVGYLVDLVHYVSTLTPVDLHRVYVWGFSNGGMMAWRAVCQTRDIFAGAGVVAGALLVPCPTVVHVVDLHGTKDRTVPYAGGYSRLTGTVFPDSFRERSKLPAGSTLKVVLINGLGHEWPPLRPGQLDAVHVLWQGLSGYRVTHPAAVSGAFEG